MMKTTPPSKKLWEAVPKEVRVKILNNAWCVRCRKSTGIVIESMQVERGDLLIRGKCIKCHGSVARVVESG